ncbi:MAG: tRNA dihydrouridine synthase DusB [Candidatus Marinimicrobia bacterium]|nr:tRNA dihydrouridine synthase DusB [Candidatus Neomarinimicrobiota bacterium]
MKIGKLQIDNPLFLAPMAGVTDHPFRVICRQHGAGVVYTEFVSSNGIIRENMKTLEMMKFTEDERPIGIQLFGEYPEVVGKSAKMVVEMLNPDIIDINYGCPVPKVTKKGAGSAALKDLCLMDDITQAVVEAVPQTPVTVKMRAGWDANHIVSTEAGIRMEEIGVSAITLHPRTTSQQFSGHANWELIKELKDEVNLPVIGNGDVNSPQDYINMKTTTGCDGVMIGRAALGNPWIFKQIVHSHKTQSLAEEPLVAQRLNIARQHFTMLRDYYDEKLCVNLTKKHFSYYFKGFPGASAWRKLLMKTNTVTELDSVLKEMTLTLKPKKSMEFSYSSELKNL